MLDYSIFLISLIFLLFLLQLIKYTRKKYQNDAKKSFIKKEYRYFYIY